MRKSIKKYFPENLLDITRSLRRYAHLLMINMTAVLNYPLSLIKHLAARKRFLPNDMDTELRRSFKYRRTLLPNIFLSDCDDGVSDGNEAKEKTGLSIGYPAWNLLYYSLVCSLSDAKREAIAVETGTNFGFSTIVMAQALHDTNAKGFVHTVDVNKSNIEVAKQNVEKAGLSKYVKFYEGDAIEFLCRFAKDVEYIDFIFIDDLHEYRHIRKEFSLIYPKLISCKGKAYFDNTVSDGVAEALRFIKYAYPGNMIEFRNCSWNPPGNVIWQPD